MKIFLNKMINKYINVNVFSFNKTFNFFYFLGFYFKKKGLINYNNNMLRFFSSEENIKLKLIFFGFCFKEEGIIKVKACLRYYTLNHSRIIYFFNSIFKSILIYYSFVLNLLNLKWIVRFIMWISLALLIKRKFKLLRLQQIIYTFRLGLNIGLSIHPLFIL
jgi:hypothetical protein